MYGKMNFGCLYLLSQACLGLQTWRFTTDPKDCSTVKDQVANAFINVEWTLLGIDHICVDPLGISTADTRCHFAFFSCVPVVSCPLMWYCASANGLHTALIAKTFKSLHTYIHNAHTYLRVCVCVCVYGDPKSETWISLVDAGE